MASVSVVIPLYNKALYIKKTINSVLSQSFQNFELIVVDDGSTDNGAEIVRSFQDPRICLIQQDNAGVSAARNRGIKEARTELIAFLDADDEWKPSFLETVLRLRREYPEAGAYATGIESYDSITGKVLPAKLKHMPPSPWEGLVQRYFFVAAHFCIISSSSVMIPKYIFERVGDFPLGETRGEDLDMWGRVAIRYPIAYTHQICANIFMNTHNSARIKNQLLTKEWPFKKSASRALNSGIIPDDVIPDLKEYVAVFDMYLAGSLIRNGDPETAIQILRDCETSHFYLIKLGWSVVARLDTSLAILLWRVKGKIIRNLKFWL